MKTLILISLLALYLVGTQLSWAEPNGVAIWIKVYSPAALKQECLLRAFKPEAESCSAKMNGVWYVIVPPGSSCIHHEIDHILYGEWHSGRSADCSERAKP